MCQTNCTSRYNVVWYLKKATCSFHCFDFMAKGEPSASGLVALFFACFDYGKKKMKTIQNPSD
jgi:hypothetical protein